MSTLQRAPQGAPQPDPDQAPEPRGLGLFLREIPPSLVVFLVAVPLSMGIALASGAPIMAGLIAAVLGGVVVGALAGAPLQVSGPAAGLAVLVFGYVQQFGLRELGAIVVVAGLLQVALGAARIARGALAISPAIIHGMLAGIGVQIALAQLHVVLGGSPQSSALRNIAELPGQVLHLHGAATALGLLTVGVLLAWSRAPERVQRVVPAPLAAVVTATVVGLLAGMDVPRVALPGAWTSALSAPSWPGERLGAAALAAVTIAIVASAESLLSAVATDRLHGGRRADLDRELLAQGVGNVLAGACGALPITGVIVRSKANITAGARTRWSAVLHGAWIVLFVTQLGGVLRTIPLAALAGLLVVVGVRLVDVGHLKDLSRHGQLGIYLATLAGVVGINLLAGIGIGVALAVLLLLRRLTRISVAVEERASRWHVVITGSLTFVGVPELTGALAAIPPGRSVDVDLNVDTLDHAAFEALHNWRLGYEKAGGQVDIDKLHEAWSARDSLSAGPAKAG
ncbi:MAG: SulP family inorganic anion transporter [Deltaproteobacteria bacterium]|nr:SulP family inorganic anion transporter [Deltaproteobacteria bacterium]